LQEKWRDSSEALVLRDVCELMHKQPPIALPIAPDEYPIMQGDPESGRKCVLQASKKTVEQAMLEKLNPGDG